MDRSRKQNREGHEKTFRYKSRQEVLLDAELTEDKLAQLLEQNQGKGRQLIVTDGVFSMDGDVAPLRQLVELKQKYKALLMVDDAHGTGVIGAGGRGSVELCGVAGNVDILMGTLGKGLGSFGAYAAASAEIVDYLRNKARSYIFSTSLPPAVLAASLAAIDLVGSPDGARLRERLARHAEQFRTTLAGAGFDTMGSSTQIVPILVGEPAPTMEFSRLLLEEGFFVQGIRPPTVPAGSCRLRCTLMATHSDEELSAALAAIIRIGHKLAVIG